METKTETVSISIRTVQLSRRILRQLPHGDGSKSEISKFHPVCWIRGSEVDSHAPVILIGIAGDGETIRMDLPFNPKVGRHIGRKVYFYGVLVPFAVVP